MDASFSRWVDPILFGLIVMAVALVVRARSAPASDRRGRVALVAAWAGWAVLWVTSTPLFVDPFVRALEMPPGDPLGALADAPEERTAIVVLGAGLKTDTLGAIPARERLNESGMSRIVGGARFYAAHPAAVLILSGGPRQEAEAMLDMAIHEGVPADRIAVEPASANTRENAAFAAEIARGRGTDRILVVTSALHMRRALTDFRKAGVEAVPGPVDYIGRVEHGPRTFFPDAVALGYAYRALHEVLGALKP